MRAEGSSGGTRRGIVVLATATIVGGVLALGPADAAKKPLTKKKAVKLFEEEGDVLWAKVTFDGALQAGEGVTSFSRMDEGDYLVTFTRPQGPCARLATAGDDAGRIVTTDGWSDPNTVRVIIQDDTGAFTDEPFHLALLC